MSKELDKKIAELKGDANLFKHNWSSNIVYAWQLFEELPWPKIITTDRYAGTYSGGDWLCGAGDTCCLAEELANGPNTSDSDAMNYWKNDERHFVSGNSAAEAICKVWIKWRGKK